MGFFLSLKNVPIHETEIKTLCLNVTSIDDLENDAAIKQNTFHFGKSNNSKYPEKLTRFLDSE